MMRWWKLSLKEGVEYKSKMNIKLHPVSPAQPSSMKLYPRRFALWRLPYKHMKLWCTFWSFELIKRKDIMNLFAPRHREQQTIYSTSTFYHRFQGKRSNDREVESLMFSHKTPLATWCKCPWDPSYEQVLKLDLSSSNNIFVLVYAEYIHVCVYVHNKHTQR